MIMIFPGLLFALLLNTKVQGAAAAVSPAHPCHLPGSPAAPLAGFPEAPRHSQPPAAGAGVGTGGAADRSLPGICCPGASPAAGRVWDAQGAELCLQHLRWQFRAMPLRCPAGWHGLGLQGAGAAQKREHRSSVAAALAVPALRSPCSPSGDTAPLSPSPLFPRLAGLSPIPAHPCAGGSGTGKLLGVARAEGGFGAAVPVLVPALSLPIPLAQVPSESWRGRAGAPLPGPVSWGHSGERG